MRRAAQRMTLGVMTHLLSCVAYKGGIQTAPVPHLGDRVRPLADALDSELLQGAAGVGRFQTVTPCRFVSTR